MRRARVAQEVAMGLLEGKVGIVTRHVMVVDGGAQVNPHTL
jgi:hypothetical protein